jgi:hypothetical protein
MYQNNQKIILLCNIKLKLLSFIRVKNLKKYNFLIKMLFFYQLETMEKNVFKNINYDCFMIKELPCIKPIQKYIYFKNELLINISLYII